MATYRDSAIAAYQARNAAWITKAKERLRPLMTDTTKSPAQLVLDPIGKTTVAHQDPAEGLVILTTTDGSAVSFAVYPDRADQRVQLVMKEADGTWTRGPSVADLDDVGEAIANGVLR